MYTFFTQQSYNFTWKCRPLWRLYWCLNGGRYQGPPKADRQPACTFTGISALRNRRPIRVGLYGSPDKAPPGGQLRRRCMHAEATLKKSPCCSSGGAKGEVYRGARPLFFRLASFFPFRPPFWVQPFPPSSGVARLERAREQGFQKGPLFPTQGSSAPLPRRYCTPCIPYCYATVPQAVADIECNNVAKAPLHMFANFAPPPSPSLWTPAHKNVSALCIARTAMRHVPFAVVSYSCPLSFLPDKGIHPRPRQPWHNRLFSPPSLLIPPFTEVLGELHAGKFRK